MKSRIVSVVFTSWLILSGGIINVATASSDLAQSNNDTQSLSPSSGNNESANPHQSLDSNSLVEENLELTSSEVALDNTVDSSALSGDTNLVNNTEVASGSTGDASIEATVITFDSQSSNNLETNLSSYVMSPDPNREGDIVFSLDSNIKSSDTENIPVLLPIKSELYQTSNTVSLSSSSGNLTAESNTSIGGLSTGDSYANANVINILGSNVSAPEIFLGYITVRGDLKGDILLSDSMLSDIKSTNNEDAQLNQNNGSLGNYELENEVVASSNSGEVNASKNSSVGDVKTGFSTNMLTVHDLLGIDAYGQSGILVFINVTGTWDGSIIGQDRGVTSALIGYNSGSSEVLFLPLLEDSKQTSLKNSIYVTSNSGNITATKNSRLGDISTGSAVTLVNIANIVRSNLIFSKNFGILFITIIGDWFGSFGLDTPYGGQKVESISNENIKNEVQTAFILSDNQVSAYRPALSQLSFVFSSFEEILPNANAVINYEYQTDDYSQEINDQTASYLTWLVPLIGGSIALGLLKASDKFQK